MNEVGVSIVRMSWDLALILTGVAIYGSHTFLKLNFSKVMNYDKFAKNI